MDIIRASKYHMRLIGVTANLPWSGANTSLVGPQRKVSEVILKSSDNEFS